mgnify:CR=1 FL=1
MVPGFGLSILILDEKFEFDFSQNCKFSLLKTQILIFTFHFGPQNYFTYFDNRKKILSEL